MYKRLFFAMAVSLVTLTLHAKSLDVQSPFSEQKARIEAGLADGETYSEISQADRKSVKDALNRIADTLGGSGIQSLSEAQKAAVFNDQELVNNILTKASADSRVVCLREKKVGSHRTTSRCMTVGERTRNAEDSQKALRDNQRVMAPLPN